MPKKLTKRFKMIKEKVDSSKSYTLLEAVNILKSLPKARFDETVELALKMGLDVKHSDQQLRGTVVFPHGIGKIKRILVFAKGDKETEARDAGADFVGGEELIDKIKAGWSDFDVAIATPDMMKFVGKLGKVLGPKGMMPNPKTGTVTMQIEKAVREFKSGKVEFRTDKFANMQIGVGKISFDAPKLVENIVELMDLIWKMKPASAKGTYIRSLTISTTMGPGLKISLDSIRKAA